MNYVGENSPMFAYPATTSDTEPRSTCYRCRPRGQFIVPTTRRIDPGYRCWRAMYSIKILVRGMRLFQADVLAQ